jgi:hypothetical protein
MKIIKCMHTYWKNTELLLPESLFDFSECKQSTIQKQEADS